MAKLTSKQRNKLPSSSFAEPKSRKYPLDTKNRARNALARVSQFGSAKEKSAVRRKVSKKFPSIGVSGAQKGKSRKSGRKKIGRKG